MMIGMPTSARKPSVRLPTSGASSHRGARNRERAQDEQMAIVRPPHRGQQRRAYEDAEHERVVDGPEPRVPAYAFGNDHRGSSGEHRAVHSRGADRSANRPALSGRSTNGWEGSSAAIARKTA